MARPTRVAAQCESLSDASDRPDRMVAEYQPRGPLHLFDIHEQQIAGIELLCGKTLRAKQCECKTPIWRRCQYQSHHDGQKDHGYVQSRHGVATPKSRVRHYTSTIEGSTPPRQ